MATHRLPTPGSDDGTWGDVLNDFLGVSHNPDGTLAANTVGAAQIQGSSIPSAKLDSTAQNNLTKASTSVQQVNNVSPNGSGAVTLAASDVGAIPTSAKGAVSGVATLDGTTKVPVAQIPDLSSAYGPGGTAGNIDWFNVKVYGAVGDGVNDDLSAIQAAINACQTAGGGVVYLPRGTYLVSNTIVVGIGTLNPVHLVGDGGGHYGSGIRTIINYVSLGTNRAILQFNQNCISGGASNLIINQGNVVGGVSGIVVNGGNVNIKHVGIGNCTADGLAFIATSSHVSLCTADDVVIQGCATGLHMKGNNAANLDCNGVVVTKVRVTGSTTNDVVLEDRVRGNMLLGLCVIASHGTQPVKVGDGTIAANSNMIVGLIEGTSGMAALTLANAPGTWGSIRTNGVGTVLAADAASSWDIWDASNAIKLEGGNRSNARRRVFVALTDTPDTGVVGTAWSYTYSGAAPFTGFAFNGAGAQNDAGQWYADLEQGTYTLKLYGLSNTTGPIATVDISFDGGTTWTAIGTWDQYAGSATASTTTFTGITIPSKGPALLRFRALTRNASNTTGWIMRLSAASFLKTA